MNVLALNPDHLEETLRSIGKNMAVTRGYFETPIACEVRDLTWNLMDQNHRPWIHDSYHNARCIAKEPNFYLSLSARPSGGFPFLVVVSNVRIGPGIDYQVFNLFSILYVHIVRRCLARSTPEGERATVTNEWYVVSHRWFKPLHGFFHRSFLRLNKKVHDEDEPIHIQRTKLRDKGYRFHTDDPDFVTSSALTNNVIPPAPERTYRIPLDTVTSDEPKLVSAGQTDLLIQREDRTGIRVWTAACPHEGGPLQKGKRCNEGKKLQCPWHGLKFKGVYLDGSQSDAVLGNLALTFRNDHLLVRAAPCVLSPSVMADDKRRAA